MVWIALAMILVAVVLLVTSLFVVAGRVRPLRRAVRRLRVRADQAERLRRRGAALQSSVVELQAKLEEAAARAERLRP
jgi:malonyl CoA-acyl carrier protein transacylase